VGVIYLMLNVQSNYYASNPLGVSGNYDRITFAPYYLFKDLITIFIFIFGLSLFVFFAPNVLGDSDNYIIRKVLVIVRMNFWLLNLQIAGSP
jgi:quinol-cytochrome oxidoreductase complex cytochrome b subunit